MNDSTIRRPGQSREPQVVRARDLLREAQPVRWVIRNILPDGGLIVVAGSPKIARKTYTVMRATIAVSRGEDFCGLATQKRKVLYIFLEDGRRRVAWRLKQLGLTPLDEIEFYAAFDGQDVDALLTRVEMSGQPLLVVIDPLVILERLRRVRDENVALEIEGLFGDLRRAAQASGSTIVLVHHYRKAGDTMRGSVALEGSSDGWWDLKPWGRGKLMRLHCTLRDAEDTEVAFEIVSEGDKLTFERREVPRDDSGNKAKRAGEDLKQRILSFLGAKNPEGKSQLAIAKAMGVAKSAIQKQLKALEEAGQVKRYGKRGGYHCPLPTATGLSGQ